jgi:hypothetical protein
MSLIWKHKKILTMAIAFMFAWVAGAWFILDVAIVQAAGPHDPVPWTNFYQSFVLWSITGVLAISGVLCIIVALIKNDPKRKTKKVTLK